MFLLSGAALHAVGSADVHGAIIFCIGVKSLLPGPVFTREEQFLITINVYSLWGLEASLLPIILPDSSVSHGNL